MKYRLKKDLPWAEAGTICEVVAQERCLNGSYLMKDTVLQNEFTAPYATFSDWFEEVDERWKPTFRDQYWFAATYGGADFDYFNGEDISKGRYENFNMFPTKELAEQAAEQVKALLKEFHKNNP